LLTFTTLASGSSGNAALISCKNTHILLDAGISAKRIAAGLRELGVSPDSLAAILITHEHFDHISGLRVLSKKISAPIYATGPTCRYLCRNIPSLEGLLQEQEAGTGVEIGGLSVRSFPTPHDAAGSVGYSIRAGGARLTVCTDLGYITPEVLQAAEGCDLLVCETNHDEDWIRSGPYPYGLKARILGKYGHLSNEAGAELAVRAVQAGARAVVLAHLSAQNNTPEHALEVAARRLRAAGFEPGRDLSLRTAPRSGPGPTWRLEQGEVRLLEREEEALC